MRNPFTLVIIIFFFYLPASLWASDPTYITFPSDISWQTKSSEHFQIIFGAEEGKGKEAFAERALVAAEKAHRLLRPIFPDGPDSTWIVLADFKDSLNGYALNFPYSHIVLFTTPPEPGEQLANLDDWLASLILHEYVHILHLYPAHGLWRPLRFLFGSWVLPNGLMPTHLHEGLATFLETEFTEGGRGRSPLFSMYRRKAVEAGVWGESFVPLDLLDGSATRWPGGASSYFFGVTLYQDLWKRKGKKGIYDLTLSYSSNWPFLVNIPPKEVYGNSYSEIWKNIYEVSGQETKAEIEKIKKEKLSPLKYLSSSRFHKWAISFTPEGDKILYAADSAKETPHVEWVDIKTRRKGILELEGNGPFNDLCWQGSGPLKEHKLYYISTVSSNGYSTHEVFRYDFKTKKSMAALLNQKEFKNIHRVSCARSSRSLIVYQEQADNGVVLKLSEEEKSTSEPAPNYKATATWKVPKGAWVTSVLQGEGNAPSWFMVHEHLTTHLYRWNENADPVVVSSFTGNAYSLRTGGTIGAIEFIADFDGRYEVWELDTRLNKVQKRIAVVGGVNSFARKGKEWVVSSYEHGGYDLAQTQIVETPSRSLPSVRPHSEAREPSSEISATSSYSPFGTLFPRTWIPSLLFVPDGVQIGAWIPGFDLSQKHYYDLFGGYDTRGLAFANANYFYRFGSNYHLVFGANLTPSYLQASKSFYKRWGGQVGVGGQLPWLAVNIELRMIFNRLESSPLGSAQQSIGAGIDLSKSFGFPSRRLAISPVNGTKITLSHAQYFKSLGSSSNYFSAVAKWDNYLEAPWWKSSVFYLGGKLGYTEGTTFINSYFEGGGELLFYQSRGFFLNRGFQPGIFAGRRMFTGNVEYRFPLTRIDRGFKLWPGHLQSFHAALVADTTSYDFGTINRRDTNLFKTFYTSCGLELKSDWKFFYYLPTQIRMGAYHGFGPFGENLYLTMGVEAGL